LVTPWKTAAEILAMEFPAPPPEPETTPLWSVLVAAEPRLEELLQAVRTSKPPKNLYAWYLQGGFKDRLCKLVGRDVDNPLLGTSAAYDVAYVKLFHALSHRNSP
jgi:hypothetical protein